MLLHGVTGSGKTEVYIEPIREVVGYGRQAIVLVPEISLTPQTIRRFRTRFPNVAVLHSHLSDAGTASALAADCTGEGTGDRGSAGRSLFTPCPHLGLIIIDEEHETSFKQDSTPRYHAREVARKRGEIEKVPVLLGSATPTLESWLRATEGEDLLISMPKRVEGLPMPPVVVVDIRNDPECNAGASLGRALKSAMQNALQSGGQVILFLNMRGFSPQIWCRACGEGVQCPHCARTLSWHKDMGVALCHECDFRMSPPSRVRSAGTRGYCAQGWDAEAGNGDQEEFRNTNACGWTNSMSKPGSHHQVLEMFRKGEVRILLGTQMIAKGLDFPNVTLVGVVNADTSLHQPDFRATERTFHLIASGGADGAKFARREGAGAVVLAG
ncbi:MAG: primosomal protein N' [Planctomycetales bacterium]